MAEELDGTLELGGSKEQTPLDLLAMQLMQSSIVAQNNFITTQKIADYNYLENKRLIDVQQSLGVREVSKRVETEE